MTAQQTAKQIITGALDCAARAPFDVPPFDGYRPDREFYAALRRELFRRIFELTTISKAKTAADQLEDFIKAEFDKIAPRL